MVHVYKLLITCILSSLAFFISESQLKNVTTSQFIGGSVFLFALFVFYIDKLVFPKLKPDLVFHSGIGLILGLTISYLLKTIIQTQELIIPVYCILGLLGVKIGVLYNEKIGIVGVHGVNDIELGKGKEGGSVDKILDTSVVIDGRILDIADTHFIDGPLVLPNFVLREIQLISDSSDPIKRARGRRGLEMLNKLQKKGSMRVRITYQDYSDTREVDAKLVKLALETGGKLITNDFNLNKVAELQGIDVLNLNNLANALKPVVLPGEQFLIQVIKEGKDANQGIGYLEDGTMVVIENGGYLVGKEVSVTVTSIIQTSAGKMIFTKNGDDHHH